MDYTDEQIADYARQLGTKGASPAEIEQFVSSAKGSAALEAAKTGVANQRKILEASPAVQSQNKPGIGGALADAGMEGGGAAIGQMAGAATGPLAPAAVPVLGAVGAMAGNAAGQMRRMYAGEQQGFKYGQFLGAAPIGAIPGGSLARAPLTAVAKEGLAFAAANTGSKAIETSIDQGRPPTLGETRDAASMGFLAPFVFNQLKSADRSAAVKQIQNSARDKTLREAQQAGYVISPSKVNPSAINNLLESIAGKASTAQESAIRNQEITNALARKAIGLPVEAPLVKETLMAVEAKAAAPYRELEGLADEAKKNLAALEKSKFTAADAHELAIQMADPATVKARASLAMQAGADVRALQKARHDVKDLKMALNTGAVAGDPTIREKLGAAVARVETLENNLVQGAKEMGRPDLAEDIERSRILIAKSKQIRKSLIGEDEVSAHEMGNAIIKARMDNRQPLTGNLKLIGDFANRNRQGTRLASRVPSPGVSNTNILAAGALATVGGVQAGAKGAAMAGIPFLRGPTRAILLSKPYQQFMAQPRYGGDVDARAFIGRNATAAAGRNNFLQFLSEAYPVSQ